MPNPLENSTVSIRTGGEDGSGHFGFLGRSVAVQLRSYVRTNRFAVAYMFTPAVCSITANMMMAIALRTVEEFIQSPRWRSTMSARPTVRAGAADAESFGSDRPGAGKTTRSRWCSPTSPGRAPQEPGAASPPDRGARRSRGSGGDAGRRWEKRSAFLQGRGRSKVSRRTRIEVVTEGVFTSR